MGVAVVVEERELGLDCVSCVGTLYNTSNKLIMESVPTYVRGYESHV